MNVERIKSVIQIKDFIPLATPQTLFLFSAKCECVTHLNGNVSVAEIRDGLALSYASAVPSYSEFSPIFPCLSPALIVFCMCARVWCHNTILHLALAFLRFLFMHSVHLFFIYCLCVLDICISLLVFAYF